ncbi:MAG: tryptophan synthase subunit alpha [Acetobacteraceae bacterium]|nr:tryptophan synthase subunit alpha [Acetobacteraceae bacterium]
MRTFFPKHQPKTIGLAVFLNAGDPALEHLEDLILLLDAEGIDCLELAVPFPDSISDGPAIQRSAVRALQRGIGLGDVLGLIDRVRPQLQRLRIALLADWSHTVKPLGLREFIGSIADSGADGLLIHGLPPRVRSTYYEITDALQVPIITTCYATSGTQVKEEALRHASAYLYLVAQYGRTGTTPADGYEGLATLIQNLRSYRNVPIAVGFGIKTRAHVDALRDIGADAAIIGSAFVTSLEPALIEGRSPVLAAHAFLASLRDAGESEARVPLSRQSA